MPSNYELALKEELKFGSVGSAASNQKKSLFLVPAQSGRGTDSVNESTVVVALGSS